MRALVTGGAGFIGSHIADALIARGHEVLVIDDLSRGKKTSVPEAAKLVVASITTPEAERAIAEFKPEVVHHHAAQIDVRISVADPMRDADINVLGTVRVAQAAVAAGAKTFIFASTGGAIYGEQERFPADEDHPVRSDSPYGISKRCAEIYLDYFARKCGLRAVALRYANVYGPRQDPHGEAGVVAIFSEKMLRGQTPVVFGDGGQTRDYVFVGDVVRANMTALENAGARGAYNVGTGVETDVNTLAKMIAVHAKYTGEIKHEAAKPGEQRRSVLDGGRARRELGFAPECTLERGLGETVAFFASKS
ncbi:MAG: NAD-dependent epimerase/dehydratase family protein [Deltaproteobacteria bacterium]|nr:NAD-dependent epimerase/dehydratase family protein [Deltaproteobacteria bacterium]